LPIWIALFWDEFQVGYAWLGVALASLGLIYVGVGQLSYRRKAPYRLPWHVCAYALGVSAVVVAFYEKPVLKFERILSQYLETFPKSFKIFLVSKKVCNNMITQNN